ncbi:M35 family metallo-endopeptidase [Burkholderia ubonensis]|uniref:M35 family metallo-endopeptidase n=1 Tax=Burkholderia ubonensis TaxID=101571 RepID=UPI0022B75E5A|nr:M35 family metallo-endopeptidase [Burkholderia ubonensis]
MPDSGNNHAAVCKPDSEKRVIAIYSKFCTDSDGELYHASKVKVLIHECTHYIDKFDSEDIRYGDTELGMKLFAMSNPDEAIRNADSITGYIATFDRIVIQ